MPCRFFALTLVTLYGEAGAGRRRGRRARRAVALAGRLIGAALPRLS